MSIIGDKIKQVFGSAAVYKNPANYDIFSGRNLPSFVKDYLISTHIAPDGSFKRAELARFLDDHIPSDNNAIRARLRRGETLRCLHALSFQLVWLKIKQVSKFLIWESRLQIH